MITFLKNLKNKIKENRFIKQIKGKKMFYSWYGEIHVLLDIKKDGHIVGEGLKSHLVSEYKLKTVYIIRNYHKVKLSNIGLFRL